MTAIKFAISRRTSPAVTSAAEGDWRHRSACAGEDPELFFPVGTGGLSVMQAREAKKVCRRCPVIEQCLSWAMETEERGGVWGGLSEDERRRMKRRRVVGGPIPTTRRESPFEACLARQADIERWVGEQRWTRVRIARELGVGVDTLVKAVRYFQEQRDAADDVVDSRGLAVAS